jgi:3-oxoacyl-[acyl-carrier protein] reductase
MKIGGASAPLVDPTNDLSASIPSFHPFTERLGSESLPVHACACDVADEFEVAEMAAWAGDRLRQVDILVNCAGMVYGRIINFASQLAYKGAPGLAHYCAAKAGIVGFTSALSNEGALRGVTVNAIAPGPVETELLMGLSDECGQ